MESINIYEESLNELKSVRKQLAFEKITINMKDLDAQSKERITTALAQALADRTRAVEQMLLNSQENN